MKGAPASFKTRLFKKESRDRCVYQAKKDREDRYAIGIYICVCGPLKNSPSCLSTNLLEEPAILLNASNRIAGEIKFGLRFGQTAFSSARETTGRRTTLETSSLARSKDTVNSIYPPYYPCSLVVAQLASRREHTLDKSQLENSPGIFVLNVSWYRRHSRTIGLIDEKLYT